MRIRKYLLPLFAFGLTSVAAVSAQALPHTLDIDFNTGAVNGPGADLVYSGAGGFTTTFTDDKSGNANGVHITNGGFGNIKTGSATDFVLGATDGFHSSGIVASFSQGVTNVSFFDSDDDQTGKTLFAFDQLGNLIGQDGAGPYVTTGVIIAPADAQRVFSIDTSATGGQLIWSVEFDTQPGTLGGQADGTFFTIDDFSVTYDTVSVSAPGSAALALMGAAFVLLGRRTKAQRPGATF